jgi:hypothetical protein
MHLPIFFFVPFQKYRIDDENKLPFLLHYHQHQMQRQRSHRESHFHSKNLRLLIFTIGYQAPLGNKYWRLTFRHSEKAS